MASVEERTFTNAEMELFQAKYEVFQEAQRAVEEVVGFLKKQHGADGEGWQIGQTGFFRMKEEAPATEVTQKVEEAKPKNKEV